MHAQRFLWAWPHGLKLRHVIPEILCAVLAADREFRAPLSASHAAEPLHDRSKASQKTRS